MSPAGEPVASAPLALRCMGCGSAVVGTRHTRNGYAVGYYLLHGGPTEEATLRRRDDEAPTSYRRLLHVVETITCPRCYEHADVRALWASFGDVENRVA